MKAGNTPLLGTPGSGAPSAWPLRMSQSCTAPVSLPVASVRPSGVIAAPMIAARVAGEHARDRA